MQRKTPGDEEENGNVADFVPLQSSVCCATWARLSRGASNARNDVALFVLDMNLAIAPRAHVVEETELKETLHHFLSTPKGVVGDIQVEHEEKKEINYEIK